MDYILDYYDLKDLEDVNNFLDELEESCNFIQDFTSEDLYELKFELEDRFCKPCKSKQCDNCSVKKLQEEYIDIYIKD